MFVYVYPNWLYLVVDTHVYKCILGYIIVRKLAGMKILGFGKSLFLGYYVQLFMYKYSDVYVGMDTLFCVLSSEFGSIEATLLMIFRVVLQVCL